jgi:hypothetical protein
MTVTEREMTALRRLAQDQSKRGDFDHIACERFRSSGGMNRYVDQADRMAIAAGIRVAQCARLARQDRHSDKETRPSSSLAGTRDPGPHYEEIISDRLWSFGEFLTWKNLPNVPCW